MEEEATGADALTLPDIDYTDADQVMTLVQDYGITIGIALVKAILIFLIGRWVAHALVNAVRRMLAKTDMEDTLERFLCNILNAVLMTVVLIAAIGALGVETTSLLAVLGAAGLAVGLALQGSLSNFAAGVLIVMFRPYRVGDYVEAGGVGGTVKEVQIFTTVLCSPDNKKIIVPNSQIMGGTITNYSANENRRVDLVMGIGYDDDIDKAYAVLRDILDKHPLVLSDPAPSVDLNTLADSSVNFNVRPWCKTGDYWTVYNEVTEQVKRRFDQEGIGIPFPQRDVHLYQHSA